ncbi:Cytochrome P450 [Sulfidibacter corallicola]|uniref:Cytochrome P450 n=1 Tax=Sulfidibacter corallicola TaxID=2818388 RepID=A0A8A4TRI0_SULCO|nr:cytochrome P450 [Sulfidibacter corallicola]QTD51692.1 cytochrome P450 [Sulfidibacter corallicola]
MNSPNTAVDTKDKVVLCCRHALKDRKPLGVQLEGVELVVLLVDGRLSVLHGVCRHQWALMSNGHVEGDALVCAAHGWRYDCFSGRKSGSASVGLAKFEAWIEGDSVWIDRDQVLAWKRNAAGQAPGSADRTLSIDALPTPPGVPVLGNALQLKPNRIHQILEDWCRQLGDRYRIRLPGTQIVALADPEDVRTVLRERPHRFRRFSRMANAISEIGVEGLFNAEGTDWFRQRRMIVPGFSTRRLRGFHDRLTTIVARLEKRWHHAATAGRPVDMRADLMRFTVDVTTGLSFGYDSNTIEKEGDLLQDHLNRIFPALNDRINAPVPYWRYVSLPRDRAVAKAMTEVKGIIGDMVEKSRQRLAAAGPDAAPENVLEAMLLSQTEAAAQERLSDDHLVGNVLTLLLAGEDTTANTLAWMLYLLLENPAHLATLRDEVDDLYAEGRTRPRFEDLGGRPFLDAVTQETMRLKSVAPMLFLEALQDTTVGDLDIPAGTSVWVLTRIIGLSERYFPEPEAFKPERWLTADAASYGELLFPFGYGPRFCPGRNLALLEIRALMTMLLRSFDIERVAEGEPVREHFAFTLMPSSLHLRLCPRTVS